MLQMISTSAGENQPQFNSDHILNHNSKNIPIQTQAGLYKYEEGDQRQTKKAIGTSIVGANVS